MMWRPRLWPGPSTHTVPSSGAENEATWPLGASPTRLVFQYGTPYGREQPDNTSRAAPAPSSSAAVVVLRRFWQTFAKLIAYLRGKLLSLLQYWSRNSTYKLPGREIFSMRRRLGRS